MRIRFFGFLANRRPGAVSSCLSNQQLLANLPQSRSGRHRLRGMTGTSQFHMCLPRHRASRIGRTSRTILESAADLRRTAFKQATFSNLPIILRPDGTPPTLPMFVSNRIAFMLPLNARSGGRWCWGAITQTDGRRASTGVRSPVYRVNGRSKGRVCPGGASITSRLRIRTAVLEDGSQLCGGRRLSAVPLPPQI